MKGNAVGTTLALALTLGALVPLACAQEREWRFDTGEEEAFLVFGVPETDDVGVSFWCTIGLGEIRVFFPEAGENLVVGQTIVIDVEVAGRHFSFAGETAANEEAGTTSAETTVESDNPVFSAFLATDQFSVKIGKEESVFPLQGADFESLRRVCSRS